MPILIVIVGGSSVGAVSYVCHVPSNGVDILFPMLAVEWRDFEHVDARIQAATVYVVVRRMRAGAAEAVDSTVAAKLVLSHLGVEAIRNEPRIASADRVSLL